MKHLKLFEDFNSRTPKQVAELLEDLFVEIFDKWEIKEVPVELLRGFADDGQFFANLDTEDLYYRIKIFTGIQRSIGSFNTVILQIKLNIFQPSSIERFKEMIRDCQPVLTRLKSFGVDFHWDSQMYQNPYNFGRIQYFRVVVELPNKVSESYFDDKLIQKLDDEQYRDWTERVIGPPEQNIIPLIRQQIGEIEKKIDNRFNEEFEYYGKYYEYHRKFSLSDNKSDLYVKIEKCDDEWYLVEIYSDWYYHWYLCDTDEGLKYLSDEFITELYS